MTNEQIETFNRFLVGGGGRGVVILKPPRGPISEDEAHNLAAWLIACSGGDEENYGAS